MQAVALTYSAWRKGAARKTPDAEESFDHVLCLGKILQHLGVYERAGAFMGELRHHQLCVCVWLLRRRDKSLCSKDRAVLYICDPYAPVVDAAAWLSAPP
jgi:hypothetical protein